MPKDNSKPRQFRADGFAPYVIAGAHAPLAIRAKKLGKAEKGTNDEAFGDDYIALDFDKKIKGDCSPTPVANIVRAGGDVESASEDGGVGFGDDRIARDFMNNLERDRSPSTFSNTTDSAGDGNSASEGDYMGCGGHRTIFKVPQVFVHERIPVERTRLFGPDDEFDGDCSESVVGEANDDAKSFTDETEDEGESFTDEAEDDGESFANETEHDNLSFTDETEYDDDSLTDETEAESSTFTTGYSSYDRAALSAKITEAAENEAHGGIDDDVDKKVMSDAAWAKVDDEADLLARAEANQVGLSDGEVLKLADDIMAHSTDELADEIFQEIKDERAVAWALNSSWVVFYKAAGPVPAY